MVSWLVPFSITGYAASGSGLGLGSASGSVLDLAGALFGVGPGIGLGMAPGTVLGTVRVGATMAHPTATLFRTSFPAFLTFRFSNPISRPGAKSSSPVVRIGKLTSVQRKTPAAYTLRQSGLEAFQFADSLINALSPGS